MSDRKGHYHPYAKNRKGKGGGSKSLGSNKKRTYEVVAEVENDKDDLIASRIQKERPTRTLFVRNINYEMSEREVRRLFEPFGDIKRFFNLIERRGMAFVTYYDIRAAEEAKIRLQAYEFNRRPIDVHFALPKDEEIDFDDASNLNTGTLFVTVRNASTPPRNSEIQTFFEHWGPVREVRDCKDSPNQKFVEFYDLRDSEKAYDEANEAHFLDGTLSVKYALLQRSKDREPKYERNENPRGVSGGSRDLANVPLATPNLGTLPFPSNYPPSLNPNQLTHLSSNLPNFPTTLNPSLANPLLFNSNLIPYTTPSGPPNQPVLPSGGLAHNVSFDNLHALNPALASNLNYSSQMLDPSFTYSTLQPDTSKSLLDQFQMNQMNPLGTTPALDPSRGESVPNAPQNVSVQQLQLLKLLLQQQQQQQARGQSLPKTFP